MLYFDSLIKNFKDYEKFSFTKQDAISICIQKLTTHNFHCNLLDKLTQFVFSKPDLHAQFFQHVLTEFENISATDKEIQDGLKSLDAPENRNLKKNIEKVLNESNNRLFYNKQGLLQAIMDAFGEIKFNSLDCHMQLEKIRDLHETLLGSTISPTNQSQQTYARKSKKPEDFSKAEAVVDIPAFSEKRINYFLVLCVFFAVVLLGAVGAYRYSIYHSDSKITQELQLPIKIQHIDQHDSQMDITVSIDEWKKLSQKNREEVAQKFIQLLKQDRILKVCVLYGSDRTVIRTLNERM
jgi:hypothetical protein